MDDDAYQELDAYKHYVRLAGRFPVLTPAQERELFQRLERGDVRARERIVDHNLKLVLHIARRYRTASTPVVDLIQAGNLGLLRAIEKFEWRLGFKFSTYAVNWIDQAMRRQIDADKLIHVPIHVQSALRGVKGQRATEETRAAGQRALSVSSLDELLDDQDGERPQLEIPDDSDPAGDALDAELAAEIDQALAALTDREATVLRMRFGLAGSPEHTLDEVGRRLGVSRERVRQIQHQALRQLRHSSLQGYQAAA